MKEVMKGNGLWSVFHSVHQNSLCTLCRPMLTKKARLPTQPSVPCNLTIAPWSAILDSKDQTTMISRLRLATRIGKCLLF